MARRGGEPLLAPEQDGTHRRIWTSRSTVSWLELGAVVSGSMRTQSEVEASVTATAGWASAGWASTGGAPVDSSSPPFCWVSGL